MHTRLYKFPSSIQRVSGVKALNALELEGQKYEVGVDGQHTEIIYDINDLYKYYPLLIMEAKKRGTNITNVAITLPLDVFVDSMSKREAGMENLIENLSERIVKNVKDVENVIIYPQGLSALYRHKKMFKEDITNKNILFIDGGFNSLIIGIASFDKNNIGSIKFNQTIFNELGIRDLLENYFVNELKTKYEVVSSNLQVLNRIFQEEKINSGIGEVNISNEKKRAISIFADKVFSRIGNIIDKQALSYDAVVVLGGLSYLLGEVETKVPVFHTRENAEYLTTLGILEQNPEFSVIDGGFGDTKVGANIKDEQEE